MSLPIVAVVATVVVSLSQVAEHDGGQPQTSYPPSVSAEGVREWIERAPKAHPRLLIDAEGLDALRASIEDDPLRKKLAETVVLQAEALLGVPSIERKLKGRRLLGQSRTCVQRVLALSMAYHLTGEETFVRRCEAEMLAAARFEDWNPSHFLDVAEMTFALAIGYDWLHDQLGDGARAEIRAAIVAKGLSLPFGEQDYWWVRATNNWGQVCHGGLTAGALAVMEHEPDLAARTVHSALENVTRSMAVYAPNGSYPEGPGYWGYGTTYNVLLIASLESALGTDFGLASAPGFDETGAYPCLMTGTSGRYFNYSDGGWGRIPRPALLWFAERYGRGDWLLGEAELLDAKLDALRENPSKAGRFAPLSLLWMADGMGADDPGDLELPLHWRGGGSVPVTLHRSSWSEPDAVFVGVKAGSPGANHGHMDIGSFVLDADGVRWAHDLGAESYHGIEARGMNLWNRSQDSDRWTIFRLNNHSHNTLVIDGKLQRVEGNAVVSRFSAAADFAFTIVDMGDVYAGASVGVRRGVGLLASGQVIVQDELEGLKPGTTVRWGMVTHGEPNREGDRRVNLEQDGASLALDIVSPDLASGVGPTWTVIDTATPRNEWDSSNKGTSMIAFESVVPASGTLVLCVLITPGSRAAPRPPSQLLIPLTDW